MFLHSQNIQNCQLGHFYAISSPKRVVLPEFSQKLSGRSQNKPRVTWDVADRDFFDTFEGGETTGPRPLRNWGAKVMIDRIYPAIMGPYLYDLLTWGVGCSQNKMK